MNDDRKIADKALTLLREWGWEMGLSRLKEEIAATEDEQNKAALSFLVGRLAGERGEYAEAEAQFQSVAETPALAAWALVGQAFIVLSEKDYERAHQLLDRAATKENTDNAMLLLATATHCRGAVYFHQGRVDQALASLHDALRLFGRRAFSPPAVCSIHSAWCTPVKATSNPHANSTKTRSSTSDVFRTTPASLSAMGNRAGYTSILVT
jgi:tetratricopeptide (TPR) repeat protein